VGIYDKNDKSKKQEKGKMINECAAEPWQTGPAPKDYTIILAVWYVHPVVACWDAIENCWIEIYGEHRIDKDPKRWATINMEEICE